MNKGVDTFQKINSPSPLSLWAIETNKHSFCIYSSQYDFLPTFCHPSRSSAICYGFLRILHCLKLKVKRNILLLRLLYPELCQWYVMVIFVCVDPPVQYRNEKMPTSQLELLFHNILHLRLSVREPLVGWLAFFILVLNCWIILIMVIMVIIITRCRGVCSDTSRPVACVATKKSQKTVKMAFRLFDTSLCAGWISFQLH